MVWMCAKVMSLSSSRSSRIWSYAARRAQWLQDLRVAGKNVVDCDRVHVFEGLADFANFTEVVVDIVLGVAVPFHEASNLAGKKDCLAGLQALVPERESIERGFPYLLSAQKLVRAVFVKNGEGVGELGPQRYNAATYSVTVFKEVSFNFVHSSWHP